MFISTGGKAPSKVSEVRSATARKGEEQLAFGYKKYSNALKQKYGEKVYKLPINLDITCPNRDGTIGTGGCIFCGECAAGFESLENKLSVKEQLEKNMAYIGPRYGAKKFIAFFQNFTNTYMPVTDFERNIFQTKLPNIVEVCVSTRPDCVEKSHLEVLKRFYDETGINVSLELGLQTANEKTLKIIRRGHGFEAFANAVNLVHSYGFPVCAHIITDLPWDTDDDVKNTAKKLALLNIDGVKLHSLYVVKGTELARMYQSGEIKLLTREDYVRRAVLFLRHLNPDCAIERIIGRAPEKDTLVANFGTSWWLIKEEIENIMKCNQYYQGELYSGK